MMKKMIKRSKPIRKNNNLLVFYLFVILYHFFLIRDKARKKIISNYKINNHAN